MFQHFEQSTPSSNRVNRKTLRATISPSSRTNTYDRWLNVTTSKVVGSVEAFYQTQNQSEYRCLVQSTKCKESVEGRLRGLGISPRLPGASMLSSWSLGKSCCPKGGNWVKQTESASKTWESVTRGNALDELLKEYWETARITGVD
jgi:hypothetical protein